MNPIDEQLLQACQTGDIHTAQKLLKKGANPNIKNRDHITPFLLATINGDIKMLQLMLKFGADPYTKVTLFNDALYYAVLNRRHHAVEYLITQLQFDPNTRYEHCITPFLIAAENGDIKMLKLLAKLGANPYTTDSREQNAFYYAIKNRHYDTAEYLITQFQFDPNSKDIHGVNTFLLAAENGDVNMLQRLIQLGVDPYVKYMGQTALHYAVKKRHHQAAQYLITQLQFDPNTQDNDGVTPFILAAKNGDIKMLQLLLQHGANPHIKERLRGRDALHITVAYGHHHAAQYLITQLHLNPNNEDKNGITPLMTAAFNGDFQMLQLLIQLGANPYITSRYGQNLLTFAVKNRQYKVTHYLLTELKINPNTQDEWGQTPFLITAELGDMHILKLLIQHGANPSITDNYDQNALHYALKNKKRDTARYLITQLHLNPNTHAKDGVTPFMISAKNGDIHMLQLLIQYGANPYTIDHKGRNAIDYAKDPTTIHFLISLLHLNPNTQDHQQKPLGKLKPSTITL